MGEYIFAIAIGIILIVIGIFNRLGHIEMIHSYHRKRVTEEERVPFGQITGCGMIIIGASVVLSGILSLVSFLTNFALLELIANITVFAGLAVGTVFIFYAMFKYNKGIF